MPRKTTSTESVKKFVSEFGCKLSGEFTHSHINILLICPNGHEYSCRYPHFKLGNRCSICNKESRTQKKINEYKQFIETSSDYKFIGLDDKKIIVKCTNGHEHITYYHSFKKGFRCSKCSGNKKYTFEEVKGIIHHNGYTLISDSYKNANTKLHLKCPNNHDYFTVFNSFRKGYRCQKCYLSGNFGENSPNWKGGITPISNHLRGKIDEWKISSLKAYGFKCAISNVHSRDLEIHHPYGFSTIIREIFKDSALPKYQKLQDYSDEEMDNIERLCIQKHREYGLGIPLLPEIHKEFHDIYGKGNNTISQFEEFKALYRR